MLENFKNTMKQYFEYMEACDRDGMLGLFAENAQIQASTLELSTILILLNRTRRV